MRNVTRAAATVFATAALALSLAPAAGAATTTTAAAQHVVAPAHVLRGHWHAIAVNRAHRSFAGNSSARPVAARIALANCRAQSRLQSDCHIVNNVFVR
jgi:hypothetical protein